MDGLGDRSDPARRKQSHDELEAVWQLHGQNIARTNSDALKPSRHAARQAVKRLIADRRLA
jgi:hypothetical protein